MKQLWAPWRLQFILDKKKHPTEDCVFCGLIKQGPSLESLILGISKHWAVVLNRYPYNNGHLLLIPTQHASSIAMLSSDIQRQFGPALVACEAALNECYHPDGMNFGYNLGKSAGAGIPDHIHAHIVPRWNGDTNFLPVLGETKCIPDHLETMYATVRPYIQKYFRGEEL